ncbi:MAG: LuxR C-terminal-related transcriptional regulator [Pseudonocardia sp.]
MHVVKDAPPVTVLLVGAAEPHLAAVLRAAGFEVTDGGGPDDVLRVAAEHGPDVALVDLDGAARDGSATTAVGAIEALAAERPELPVLALSAAGGAGAVLAAVRAGATGYLVRAAGMTELVDAVRRTAAGEAVFSPGLAAAALEEHSAGAADAPTRLTEREADVVALVVAGYTARQIAGRLVLSPRTVENHVQHMLRKLDLPNRAALVRYAIENGLA